MSEFVKKTMVGYKTVPGGHSDPECTHAILTLKEYDQILQEKRQAEMDAVIAKSNADKEVAKAEMGAEYTAQRSPPGGPGRGGGYPGGAGAGKGGERPPARLECQICCGSAENEPMQIET